MAKYSHYVIFTPEYSKGIYTSWEDVKQHTKGYDRPQLIGLWSESQAKKALEQGFFEARKFKEKMEALGFNKPQYPPSNGMPRLEW